MSGLCKDCIYYATEKSDVEETLCMDYPELPTCINPNNLFGYQYDGPPVDGVHIEDDEGWGWSVGPEFGCVKFQLREKL